MYDNHKVRRLHIMLSKTSAYDGQTKWMYVLIEDDYLLEKYTFWDKKNLIVSMSLIKNF